MNRLKLIIMILLLALFDHKYCNATENIPTSENITIKADSLQQDRGETRYIAKGKVIITNGKMTLQSDEATYDTKTNILIGEGSVIMTNGENILTGSRFKANLITGWIEVEQGEHKRENSNLYFSGEKIIREDDKHLTLTNSIMTTCDLPNPDWKFSAKKINVNLNNYATGRHIIFYVKNVPVLYLPWFAFPAVKERTSGLLMPRFGYSSTKGAQLLLPIYVVIAPNQDLQLDFDMQSKRGVGLGTHYRYARKRGSEGTAGGQIIYDNVENRWRGMLSQEHKEIFSKTFNVRSNLNLTSDRLFFNDFGENSGDYNRQSSDSTINVLKVYEHFAFTGTAHYRNNLYGASNRTTLQKLPEIGLAAVRLPMGKLPLYFDLDSSITNFYRESGTKGGRASAFPRLTLPFSKGGIFTSIFAGLQMGAYVNNNDNKNTSKYDNNGFLLPEAGARLSIPLQRTYQMNLGKIEKLRHEIIPEISYRYTGSGNTNQMPFYDYDDRPIAQSLISWSLTNRLSGRFKKGDTTSYRQLLNLTLSQSYTLAGSRRNLLTLVDKNHKLDDLSLESDASLLENIRLTFDSRYSFQEHHINSASPGFEYDSRQGTTIGAAYRLSRNEVEYAELRLSSKFISPWILSYTSRFSFDSSRFLESVYTAEYRQKCWGVTLMFHDRPGNKTGTINFNLAGLSGI